MCVFKFNYKIYFFQNFHYKTILSSRNYSMQASEYIEELSHLIKSPSISSNELTAKVQNLIRQTPLAFHKLDIPFIVRTSVLEPNEYCKHISGCSFNPDCTKIPLQRCNYEKQQVFYGTIPGGMQNLSDAAQSAFLETCFDRIKKDSLFSERFVVATRWNLKNSPHLWSLPFNEGSAELNQHFKFLYANYDNILKESSLNEVEYNQNKAKARFISALFCTNENKKLVYRVTSTFFNELRVIVNSLLLEKIDGLIYPSSNTKGEGMNIALVKDFITEENIECSHAVLYAYKRDPKNPKSISFEPLECYTPNKDGKIEFKNYLQ